MTVEEYAAQVVAKAPPLTAAQLDRLTVIMRPAKAVHTA